jgi:hypothetical protein
MKKNVLLLSLPGNEDDTQKSGLVIGLSGNLCALPTHYFIKIKNNLDSGTYDPYDFIEFFLTSGEVFRSITVSEFCKLDRIDIDKRDVSVFSLAGSAHMFPNILGHFINESDFLHNKFANCSLKGFNNCTEPEITSTDVVAEKLPHILRYRSTDGPEEHVSERAFSYYANTNNGDCGSILFHDSHALAQRVILGIHVAGGRSNTLAKIAFSSVVT